MVVMMMMIYKPALKLKSFWQDKYKCVLKLDSQFKIAFDSKRIIIITLTSDFSPLLCRNVSSWVGYSCMSWVGYSYMCNILFVN